MQVPLTFLPSGQAFHIHVSPHGTKLFGANLPTFPNMSPPRGTSEIPKWQIDIPLSIEQPVNSMTCNQL